MRRVIVVICAVTAGFAGPRLTRPAHSHDAGEPFVYTPPEGFVSEPKVEKDGVLAWVHPETREKIAAAVVLHHAAKTLQFTSEEMARLVSEMPKAFEDCTWVHRRNEVRTRADGSRVGLIEGDCDKEIDLKEMNLGAGSKTLHLRKVQLIFPDDKGLAIVTASYATEEAKRWEPAIEATISTAKGVATRFPPPPAWLYLSWAAGGAVLGALLARFVLKKKIS